MRVSDAWEGTLALFFVRAHGWIPRKSQKKRERVSPGTAAPLDTRRRRSRAQVGSGYVWENWF